MKSRTIDGKRTWKLEPADINALSRAFEVLEDIGIIGGDADATKVAAELKALATKHAPPVSAKRKSK